MKNLSKTEETKIELNNGYVLVNWLDDQYFAQATQFNNTRFVGGVNQKCFSSKTSKSILNKISKL